MSAPQTSSRPLPDLFPEEVAHTPTDLFPSSRPLGREEVEEVWEGSRGKTRNADLFREEVEPSRHRAAALSHARGVRSVHRPRAPSRER